MSFLLDVVNDLLLDDSGDVLSLVLNSVVILYHSLNWDSLASSDFFILSNNSLDWNLLNSLDLVVNNTSFLNWNVLDSAFG